MLADAGDEINAARSRVILGVVLHGKGQTEQALTMHREVEPLLRRLSDRPWLARVVNNQGVFLATLGQTAEAAQAYEEAVELHLVNADHSLAASSLLNWAELLLDHGQATEARTRLEQAEELLFALPSPPAWVVQTYEILTRRIAEATQPG